MLRKVLLIEHEEDLRMGAAEVFLMNGVLCDVARHFDEAISKFDLSSYPLILSVYPEDKVRADNIVIIKKPYTAHELMVSGGVI